jgi:CRISPR-associated protein Csc1
VQRGIYITPATFLRTIDFKQDRFNCQPDRYNLTWKPDKEDASGPRGDGYPDEGHWQMICRNNIAVFYVISYEDEEIALPTYIRLGKFNSKCKITYHQAEYDSKNDADQIHQTDLLLRAEDLPVDMQILQYDRIPIQHGTYLQNVTFTAPAHMIRSRYWKKNSYPIIPDGMTFYAAATKEVTG